jgi:hypothetical protein
MEMHPVTGGIATVFQAGPAGPGQREALAHVLQGHLPPAAPADAIRRQGIMDLDIYPAICVAAGHAHGTAVTARFDAVIDGILDQRLQREPRQMRIGRHTIHLPVNLEALA